MALAEVTGEYIADLAKGIGVKVAPGDAGDRLMGLLRGQDVSPDTAPELFQEQADDTGAITANGRQIPAKL